MTALDIHAVNSEVGVCHASGEVGPQACENAIPVRARPGMAAVDLRLEFRYVKAIRTGGMVFTAVWLLLSQLFVATSARAQPVALTEYAAKAALLFNIAKYAEWPTTTFLNSDSPIVIGILGVDPFGDVLDRVVRGRKINGRSIAIRRAGGVEALRGAHLVFVSATEAHSAHDWAVLESFNVITVGDTDQTALFTALNVSFEDDRIIFTVDLGRAARAGVTISSKLLNLAKAVKRAEEDKTQ